MNRLSRHHILLAGLLMFLAGIQFRVVESFTLSEGSSHFVAAQLGNRAVSQAAWSGGTPGHTTFEPPRWLGLALMSVGAVLTVKSLSMKG